jgi:hypothetical protein
MRLLVSIGTIANGKITVGKLGIGEGRGGRG